MVLVAIGVIVSGAAAVFAWVQAHAALESLKDARAARDEARDSATESARLAGEANEAFRRQAEAQEEANRLRILELTPPDWSGPVFVSGQLYRVTNTSKKVIIVRSFDVAPESAAKRVNVRGNKDGHYEYGDSFSYLTIRAMGGNAEKLTVRYSYEGDDDERAFIIPL
jgi:hypothetical protein